MVIIHVKEAYADALYPLDESAEQALRRMAIERASTQIAELQQKVKTWEAKYQCSYDLFAFRVATDPEYVETLNASLDTQQWEADLTTWEFYADELSEWYRRLQNILTA